MGRQSSQGAKSDYLYKQGRIRGSRLYYGRCIFALRYYYGETLASCHGGYFFHLVLKSEVFFKDQVEEFIKSQSMAKQSLMAAIRHQSEGESLASIERDLW